MVVGVTGNFGVGKTTVCRILESLGWVFIEADKIVDCLYAPGKAGYKKIKGYFGDDFVDPKKGVKKDKLRKIVLLSFQKMWILNKLIHPLVAHEISVLISRIKRKYGRNAFICLEAFYFEKENFGKLIDKLMLVKRVPELVFRARKKEKRWNSAELKRFMRFSPIHPKPDFVIQNNGSLLELRKKVVKLFENLIYGRS